MKTMRPLNKSIILFDIDYTLFDTSLFKNSKLSQFALYEEVFSVLNYLSKNSILGIFSEGDKDLQVRKLKETGIENLLNKDHIHISENKENLINEIVKNYKDSTLVIIDDKLDILFKIKKLLPSSKVVWVKRGVYAENQKPIPDFSPDFIIDNLNEIKQLLF